MDYNKKMNLYHEMRLEFIRNCEECRAPENEFDAGEYCEKHRQFEELDDMMFKEWQENDEKYGLGKELKEYYEEK